MEKEKEIIPPNGGDSLVVDSVLPVLPNQYEYRILRSLRQIVRAIEIHSRKLEHDFHITGPQLSCLLVIWEKGPIAVTRLAAKVFLSPGTVVGIIDRLEEKSLVQRVRSKKDRRLVEVGITEAGEGLIGQTPHPLQGALGTALRDVPDGERVDIALALEKLVDLMGTKELVEIPARSKNAVDTMVLRDL